MLKAHSDAFTAQMDAAEAQMDAEDARAELERMKVEQALAELDRQRLERPLLTIERDMQAALLQSLEAAAAGDDASVRAAVRRLQMISQMPEYRLRQRILKSSTYGWRRPRPAVTPRRSPTRPGGSSRSSRTSRGSPHWSSDDRPPRGSVDIVGQNAPRALTGYHAKQCTSRCGMLQWSFGDQRFRKGRRLQRRSQWGNLYPSPCALRTCGVA